MKTHLMKRLYWGTYGKKREYSPCHKWVPLYLLSTEHIKAILKTQPQITSLQKEVFQQILKERKRRGKLERACEFYRAIRRTLIPMVIEYP